MEPDEVRVKNAFGDEALAIYDEIRDTKPLTETVVQMARDMGETRPDWVGIIAGTSCFDDPELMQEAKDLAIGTLWYDIEFPPYTPDESERGSAGALVSTFFGFLGFLAILLVLASMIGMGSAKTRSNMASTMEEIVPLAAADSFALIVAGERFATDKSISHAIETHGAEALAAYSCFDKYLKPAASWHNDKSGNRANICFEGQNFFLQIVDRIGREITAFKRTNAKTMGDVGSYLKAQGYTK